ncbi:MAG TPA: chromate resistance protein ChrB domain-containing protein [Candidatus Saccharimonadales bacterium]|nr:chromate resistance protein ChrB domain-containing protein [Candidatus Saccharimonadales bacterium]
MKAAFHGEDAKWLLLTFTLPTKRASQRVEVWRKLQRYGVVPLGNSGYLLPNNPVNLERFEWLAQAIRKYAGEASVVSVQKIDNLSTPQLVERFTEARSRDYQELIQDLQKASLLPPNKRPSGKVNRWRARFREIVEIDFFANSLQKRVEDLLVKAEAPPARTEKPPRINPKDYLSRLWVTRPRPGIDRSASAWLIRKFIDRKARFAFAKEGEVPPAGIPFDMFQGGFGHRGEDCTFETLRKEFRIRDEKVAAVGEMVHDADLHDGKFGRKEALGVDAVLKGFARTGLPDKELLDRGMEMIEGLYRSVE